MAHAKLSPSGAHRWLRCPGSIILCEQLPVGRRSSAFADEGTAAHDLAARCLEGGTLAHAYIGESIRAGASTIVVDRTMAGYVQDYVDFVLDLAEGGTLLVEQRLPIGHLTGEEDATGTSDVVILKGSEITVVDLKYGMGVRVDAKDNEQAQMYALGALEQYSLLGDFTAIRIIIHMPRLEHVTEWVVSADDLRLFAARVADTAAEVGEARTVPAGELVAQFLSPGEKQCKFCDAKSVCPAVRAEVAQLISDSATASDFAALIVAPVDTATGDNFLSHAMAKVDLVEGWCKAVRAEVERRLFGGQPVAGFKLVDGRQGPRKWRDVSAAETLIKTFRYRQDEIYDTSLISPTTAEKLLKTDPEQWSAVQSLITRSDGKPSVAPATDPRPAKAVTATAEDFSALIG